MKVEVVDESSTEYGLVGAILLYGSKSSMSNKGVAYATLHGVNVRNGEPTIGAGRRMTRKALHGLATSLVRTGKVTTRGVIPKNVLSLGIDHVVWHEPACSRRVWFDTRSEMIGKTTGVTAQPHLVFMLASGVLSVYAVKCKGRPRDTTLLWNAPYMNVFQDGRLCVGSMRKPADTGVGAIGDWSKAFFESSFTGPNYDKTTLYAGGAYALWRLMLGLDGPAPERFPNDALARVAKTVPRTLGAWLQKVDGKR